jgi:hypothetical protein
MIPGEAGSSDKSSMAIVSVGLLMLLVVATVDCAPRIIAVGDAAANGARGGTRDDAAAAQPDANFGFQVPDGAPSAPADARAACVNLECRRHACPAGGTTSVSGTVYAPIGTLPL